MNRPHSNPDGGRSPGVCARESPLCLLLKMTWSSSPKPVTGVKRSNSSALNRPDVTLMDVQMPEVNGIDAIVKIREEFPDARIIVLTTYSGDAQAARAIKAGASGYLLKNMVRKELIDTIRTVHSGKKRIPSEIAVEMAEHHSDDCVD